MRMPRLPLVTSVVFVSMLIAPVAAQSNNALGSLTGRYWDAMYANAPD